MSDVTTMETPPGPRGGTGTPPGPQGGTSPRKAAFAGTVGITMEIYDNNLYGITAATLAPLFFPSASPVASLLGAWVGWSVAAFARPIGGLLWGHIGDRYGRRNVMALVVLTVSLGTLLVGALPTYAQIGLTATALLALFRIIVGIGMGGELGTTGPFIVEYAPRSKRGLFGSFSQLGIAIGGLLVTGTVLGVLHLLPEGAFDSWGWRLPYLFALVIGAVGLYIRLRTDETPEFTKAKESGELVRNPVREAFRQNWRVIIALFFLYGLLHICYVGITAFNISYVVGIQNLSLTGVLAAQIPAQLAFMAFIPLTGYLSDKIGRSRMVLIGLVTIAVAVYPSYVLIMDGASIGAFLIGQLMIAAAASTYLGPITAAVVSLVPPATRTTTVSLGVNLPVAVIGGTTPAAMTFLSEAAPTPAIGSSLWWFGGVALAFVAFLTVRKKVVQ